MSWTGLPQPTPRARSPLVAAAIAVALVLCLGSSCGSDDETIGGVQMYCLFTMWAATAAVMVAAHR